MTKKQELAHLTSLIKSLGPDSYLGPVLSGFYAEMEMAITSDIFPDVNLVEAGRRVTELTNQGHQEYERLVSAGKREAEKIVAQADKVRKEACDYDSRIRSRVTDLGRELIRLGAQ
jgi:hypothetical protein